MATRKPIAKPHRGCTVHGRVRCDICSFVCEICNTSDACAVGALPCVLAGEFIAGPRKGKPDPNKGKDSDSLDSGIFKDWADHVPEEEDDYEAEEED